MNQRLNAALEDGPEAMSSHQAIISHMVDEVQRGKEGLLVQYEYSRLNAMVEWLKGLDNPEKKILSTEDLIREMLLIKDEWGSNHPEVLFEMNGECFVDLGRFQLNFGFSKKDISEILKREGHSVNNPQIYQTVRRLI